MIHAPRVSQVEVRRAAVAGQFYPAQRIALADAVQGYLDQGTSPPSLAWRAVIAPHAGYPCSALIAAHSFKALAALPPADYTVYLLGPAHWLPVAGVGLSSARWFETPLGRIPVAAERVGEWLTSRPAYPLADDAHGLAFVFTAGDVFNPLVVRIVAGLGETLGEVVSYLAGVSGGAVVEERSRYQRIVAWLRRYGLVVIFALAAIPNPTFDLAGIAAGALRFPLRRFVLACCLGKMLKNVAVALLGAESLGLFVRLLQSY